MSIDNFKINLNQNLWFLIVTLTTLGVVSITNYARCIGLG